MKELIPEKYKPKVRHWVRLWTDFRLNRNKQFAVQKQKDIDFPFHISVKQPLKENSGLKGKVQNMKLAITELEKIIIEPNEVFSFWRYLKEPTLKNGYTSGRTIVNGELKKSVGGGLCQLGGLIYHISLLANLRTIERHNHSLDLYDDTTRYSPLGADAAVAYGYKDLRIKNTHDFTIKFDFIITKSDIEIRLLSTEEIKSIEPVFTMEEKSNIKHVKTFLNGVLIAESDYKLGDQL